MPLSSPAPATQTPYPGIVRTTFGGAHTSIAEYTFGPGATFPLHRHPQEQIVVVRRGELWLTVAGVQQRLAAGEWSLIAPGEDHGITAGPDGADFLAILSPPRASGEAISLAPDPTPE